MRKFIKKFCRIFFSRYSLSAIMILAEVLVIAYLFVGSGEPVYVLAPLSILLTAATLLHLINKDTNPEYKVAWLCVILLLIPVGSILYLLFYHRRMSRRESRLLGGLFDMLSPRNPECGRDTLEELLRTDPSAAGKARAIMADYALAEVFCDTSSTFFASGEAYFEHLLEDIRSAKEYIFLEYFIIDEGELWSKIHTVLREKAAQGVDVRILYDDIGCMKTLPSSYEISLRREGIRAERFAKVSPRVSAVHQNRDHRKICLVDGRVGYTGGVNIADEYVNHASRFGHWKDGGIRLEGLAVTGLLKLFISSWDFTTGTVSDYERLLNSTRPATYPDNGYYIPFGSGPSPIFSSPVGKNVFLNIINQAESYVYITTPYLIIDYDLTVALRNAALRGVDVRIVTPAIADKRIVKVMTKSTYPTLMSAGVGIYEYTPGFIHEKTLVSDGKYAVIGTINLDYRSLVHHFEDAVWIYGAPTVEVARASFCETLEVSRLMDEESARLNVFERILKSINQLFAPLL